MAKMPLITPRAEKVILPQLKESDLRNCVVISSKPTIFSAATVQTNPPMIFDQLESSIAPEISRITTQAFSKTHDRVNNIAVDFHLIEGENGEPKQEEGDYRSDQ